MAKKKPTGSNGAAPTNQDQGESVSGYFRRIFEENPQWLDERSNDALYARWLLDHPGDKEVPERVRQNLSNIKSVLRKQGRRKAGRPKKSTAPAQGAAVTAATPAEAPHKKGWNLSYLEEQIDECLTLAKVLDREGLANVISLLRRARNEVVWSMGKTQM